MTVAAIREHERRAGCSLATARGQLQRPGVSARTTTISHMRSIPADLPGAELLRDGLADLRAGRESEFALVVEIAAPRLRALGFDVPQHPHDESFGEDGTPEHRLYSLLAQRPDGGAHSYYNALLARIASFARAAEHASPS
jgi:hypothetical protein